MEKLKDAAKKTFNAFKNTIFIMLGVILLMGLFFGSIPKDFFENFSTGNEFLDPVFGSAFGSIAAGNPITSYIIGGELLSGGASLAGVTAFLVAWVTVGIVTLPAEGALLGKKFALARNAVSFVFAIIIALLTTATLGFFA